METAATIVGDREKACGLPLFEVAVDKLCACCYERAWFAKNGGFVCVCVCVCVCCNRQQVQPVHVCDADVTEPQALRFTLYI